MMKRFLRNLDARSVLRIRVWEFSWRSLGQAYGWMVLTRIVARHPLRTLRGLMAYRRWIAEGRGCNAQAFTVPSVPAGGPDARCLVALGFCQKPVGCPAGRFNHDCLALDADAPDAVLPQVCESCPVRTLGERSLRCGASFYIMTSALEIARHLFLPALRGTASGPAVLILCPFSVQPMALMLFICRIPARLLTYGEGACDTYDRWLAADQGYKPERTFMGASADASLKEILAHMNSRVDRGVRFLREGGLYVPRLKLEGDRGPSE